MTKIYKVSVNPFYIQAENLKEVYDTMWEKFGVQFTQVNKIKQDKEIEYFDNWKMRILWPIL